MRRRAPAWLLALLAFAAGAAAQGATFYYTFGDSDGGLGVVEIDPAAGRIVRAEALESPPLAHPRKVALTAGGGHAIVTAEHIERAWIFRLGKTPAFVAEVELEGVPTEVAAFGNEAILTASEGFFYRIDVPRARITRTWNARDGLTPPGRKGEDIALLGDGRALVTFQKDGAQEASAGSRLVVFDLRRFTALHDLPLPRDHPELHIETDPREQGPNPEMIFLAPRSNALILSLDLYGALAVADLDAALRGRWQNLACIPTAADGSWGTAFPDRGALLEIGGREYLLVSNASRDGGIVLFDPVERKIRQTFPCPAGAEHPVFLPRSLRAVTVVSGKIKSRSPAGLEQAFEPGSELLVFDLAPLASGGKVTMETVAFDKPVVRVQAVDPDAGNLVLLFLGGSAPEVVVYDPIRRRELDRKPAAGQPSRVAAAKETSRHP